MTQAQAHSQQPTGGGFDLGGGGGTSFSFGAQGSQPGTGITGTVIDMKEVQRTNFDTKKPEFWDNGDPKMQYRVTMQTDLRDPASPNDDGKRDLYLDGRRRPNDNGTKSRLCAVLDAVRATTGGTELQRGGKLTVRWVSGMGFAGDPRNYEASYEAPGMQLGGQQQAAPTAPPVVPTEQGQVDTQTGEITGGQTPTGPTPEAIAALRAAGIDPATVYPGQG